MIDILAIELSENLSEKQFKTLCSFISPIERRKILSFTNFQNTQCSLIGKILARILIMKHLSISNPEITISTTKYGKPYLNNIDKFFFNISHSGQAIACVASNRPIGIDIEYINNINIDIAKRFFSSAEAHYIYSASTQEEKLIRFYTIWTRKESYLKLIGKGLSLPLYSFNVINDFPYEFIDIPLFSNYLCNICTTKRQKIFITRTTIFELFNQHVKILQE